MRLHANEIDGSSAATGISSNDVTGSSNSNTESTAATGADSARGKLTADAQGAAARADATGGTGARTSAAMAVKGGELPLTNESPLDMQRSPVRQFSTNKGVGKSSS